MNILAAFRVMRPRSSCRRERGATLIEALVAMLVLSVGMLGIAGLASASLRYSQGAWARAAVSSGLSDLADRVRANPSASETDYAFSTLNYVAQRAAFEARRTSTAHGDLDVASDCLTVPCSAAQLSAYHLTDWRNGLNRSMPGAAVWVSGRRNTGYLATVMWFDKTFVKDDGTLQASEECTLAAGVITEEGIAARTCCPAAAAAPDGVRCTNLAVIP